MINLIDLEKKINSELTTKVKHTEIKHNQIYIEIDKEDNIYLVDDGPGNFVQKRDNNGKIIFTVGERGNEAPWQGGDMFNRPTDIAIHPKTGELFISDGFL